MRDFMEWFRSEGPAPEKPWLILGKGSSYRLIDEIDSSAYHLFSLNHVVRDRPVTIAHAIDIDVVADCAEAIDRNARFLLLPWVPHERFRPSKRDLPAHVQQHPMLEKLSKEGRLLFYNAATAPAHRRHPGSPVVPVIYFSAEAALGALAMAGAKTVRSLGVDGGTSYSPRFADLNDKTRLANGQPNFDKQFDSIANIIHRTGVDFSPLDMPTVKVFVGAAEEQDLAVKVLAYSIRRHASMNVDVRSLDSVVPTLPNPRSQANSRRTPFSFQRFAIPEVCGRSGRAIYLDSDMLVFKDIRQLWRSDFGDAAALTVRARPGSRRPAQNSVLLLDCERLSWDVEDIVRRLDAGSLDYKELMSGLVVDNAPPARVIGDEWNSLQYYRRGRTALLHYTDMDSQPWVSHRNPLGWLWFEYLFGALDRGAVQPADVEQAVRLGHIRPSAGYQVEHRIADARRLPRRALALDAQYVAPYQHLGSAPPRPGAHLRAGFWHRVADRIGQRLGIPGAA